MAARNYSNTSPPLQITSAVTAGAVSIPVPSTASYPAVPFTAIIARGQADQEMVLATSVIDSTHFGVTRGYDGTVGQAHASGATFEEGVGAIDYREANGFINLMSAQGDIIVYGAAGAQRLAGPASGQFLGYSASAPGVSWQAVPAKSETIVQTWAVSGALVVNSGTPPAAGGAANYLPPFAVPIITGETATLVGIAYRIRGGTSATISMYRNTTLLTSGISVTTTPAYGSYSQALANDDWIFIQVTAISGSPDGLSFSVFVQKTA